MRALERKADLLRLTAGALLCLSFLVQQFAGALHFVLSEHVFHAHAEEVHLHAAGDHHHGAHAHVHTTRGGHHHHEGDAPAEEEPHPAEDHFDELDDPLVSSGSNRPLLATAPMRSVSRVGPAERAEVRLWLEAPSGEGVPLVTAGPRAPPHAGGGVQRHA